jgi:hypothetical protein
VLNANGVVVLWDLGLDLFSYVCIGVGVVSGYKGEEV